MIARIATSNADMRRLAVILTFFCLAAPAADLPLEKIGVEQFYNLDYDAAQKEVEAALARHPESSVLHNRLAQIIQFRELFRVGALESELVSGANSFMRRPKVETTPETEKRFNDEINRAMALAQARLDKNPNDLQAMYTLGVSYSLRANWNFLVRKAWRDALRDATTGRKLHNRITDLDPSNVDAKLVQGMHDYVVGSLSTFYRLVGFLVGFRGDREQGIRTLQLVAAKGKSNSVDGKVILCALFRREQRWAEAAPLLEDLIGRFPRNYLLRFEQAQMYSSLGQKDNAIAAIRKVEEMRRAGLVLVPAEKIVYQFGNIQFWYHDYAAALENFRKVTGNLEAVDLNTAVLAWMRIGQIYDLTNRRPQALEAYKQAIRVAPEAEAAKESRRYISSPYRRG